MKIIKVKDGQLNVTVNNVYYIPKDSLDYQRVLAWASIDGNNIEPEFTPAELEAKQAQEAYEAEMKQARLDIKAFDEVRAHFRRITKDATDENELQANLLLFKDLLALMEVGSESAIQSIMNFTAEDLAPTSLTVDDRDFLVNVYNNTRAGV